MGRMGWSAIITFIGILALLGFLSASAAEAAAKDDRGWLGIYTEPVSPLPDIEGRLGGTPSLHGAECGLRVTAVFPDSPADQGGLQLHDIIIGLYGKPFTCPAESVRAIFTGALEGKQAGAPCPLRVIRNAVYKTMEINGEPVARPRQIEFWRDPSHTLEQLKSGDRLAGTAEVSQEILDLPVVLGLRPEARWPEPRVNATIYPPTRYRNSALTPLFWSLTEKYGFRAETEDLLKRLNRCHSGCDPFRLESMIYVHRNPFRLEAVSRHITDLFLNAQCSLQVLENASPLLAADFNINRSAVKRLIPLAIPVSTPSRRAHRRRLIQPLLHQIERVLQQAEQAHRRAFAALTDDEKRFLETERWNLSDAFAEDIYIHFDEDTGRFEKNKRLIELAQKIDYPALLEAAASLATLTDPLWAEEAGRFLRSIYSDTLAVEILLDQVTPAGRMLIGGTGDHWYRETDTAFIIDLGGNDFYSGNSGGNNGWDLPVAVCIDLCGDDAYESTTKGSQGAGCLGIGGLLDLSGDDSYIGMQWCQGVGYYGIGWIHDAGGDDIYRGRSYCQAVGLFGLGFILDHSGNDQYEGDLHVQGIGLAKGIGSLVDQAGDDRYYAKGVYPTGYGDAGIFDAWSQGCGMGFRTMASGGLGILVDGGGEDRLEAGNFSQGGGYYYGFGLLAARGAEDDTYIGSRYNQGFAAHQAVGVFIEEGGNDQYSTRQGVAQGLAWDECVTLFIDESGNDFYNGGQFFSLGASAHNSICFFHDLEGSDRYIYSPGPARAGGNDYHGGTSYSLFIDDGGGEDAYNAETYKNSVLRHTPEHGIFLDR
ncbi:MAG: PDZ domain-containing protein [Candidatus Eisenbacteria bacterium]|nr:PDZ domain-containing protein [Candidatus Eisenbacteria bacterium]